MCNMLVERCTKPVVVILRRKAPTMAMLVFWILMAVNNARMMRWYSNPGAIQSVPPKPAPGNEYQYMLGRKITEFQGDDARYKAVALGLMRYKMKNGEMGEG